jgi:hypothetical protein
MKTCAKCGETKELSEFYRQRRSAEGYGAYCKVCAKANATASYAVLKADPEWRATKAEACKAYYQENRDTVLAQAKEARRRPAAQRRARERAFQKAYGISLDDYEEMLAAQGNACAICREVCVTGRALAVDHDHETGQVRGLLCANCNRAIGMFQDDPDRLLDAATYLLAQRSVLDEVRRA